MPNDMANSSTIDYFPLCWDGKDSIILHADFKSITNVYKRTELFGLPKELKDFQIGTRVISGKDVEMVRIPTYDKQAYKYTVKLWDGEKYIEKELDLQNTQLQISYPIAIDNTDSELNVLVSGKYNPQLGIELFLCTVDKENWTSKWYRVTFEGEASASPGNPPMPNNSSITFGRNFYIPSGCCDCAIININSYICRIDEKVKELKENLMPPPSQDEAGARSTSILGSYDDILIAQFYISAFKGPEQYICALKNGEELLSVMHVKDDSLEVMDKDKKILSNIILDKNSFLVFPNTNGGM